MGKYRWTGIRVIKEMEQNSNKEEYFVTVEEVYQKIKQLLTKERRNKRIWNKARSGVRNRRRKRTNR